MGTWMWCLGLKNGKERKKKKLKYEAYNTR